MDPQAVAGDVDPSDVLLAVAVEVAEGQQLLGSTRARVLECASELNTSEIATRLGLSVPGASQHLTALRNAGLVASVRHRNHVVHTWTTLGRALLDGEWSTFRG